ncbi:hypothetical protein NIES2101_00390 [Calothrix sp. HK-06]|nr:hypothetical protein NIES2101_00390 [Calothrix sp. HK-06]
MSKIFAFILVILLTLIITYPAQAFTCRNYNGHQICILSIKRSAKNHWEYRASVTVDGAKTPVELYNCRQQTLTRKDGKIAPFRPDNAGEVICSFFKKS